MHSNFRFKLGWAYADFGCYNDIGTAGVWRIAAINEAGGWKDRTTVEDMDLAVRASLKGWKFVYLGSLQVSFFLSVVSFFCIKTLIKLWYFAQK